ncbi:MAG TPA: hypothetical protein VFX65_11315 [Candidatus Limnocylindrales bacterium]|nr:hypothetical protein [Candidatus Limnocylindrales bacterium]
MSLLLISLLLVLVTAAPVAASASATRYSVHGSGAWASGVKIDGERFEAAWIEIGDEATDDVGGETYFRYVLFEHFLEVCDVGGCVQTLTAGWAEDVVFSIDKKKLSQASVTVTIPAVRCVTGAEWNETCSDIDVAVDVTWSAYGATIRSHGTASGGISGVYQYTLNGAATERWATISGTVAGFDLADAGATGALYKTRYAERTIVHG